MTPQSNFMIQAAIDPAHETELRRLLDSMNLGPGEVNANNALLPFAQFESLHFARLLILDDGTLNDTRAYGGGPASSYPSYLAFAGDLDGEVGNFLREIASAAGVGLRRIFSCCTGFDPAADLVRWMERHNSVAVASYVNWRGRTVLQIREEAALREALVRQIALTPAAFRLLNPRQLQVKLQQFVNAERGAGRLQLSRAKPAPLAWSIRNFLHLIGVPLLLLLFLPLIVLLAPFFILRLRQLEKTDPELCWRENQEHSDHLSQFEDRGVTNQFSAMGSLKPGLVRLVTVVVVLGTVNYAARHFVRRGRLGRIRTIHFARWVFLDRKKRMIFFSNYDGTVESYMDDFINKTGFGLNAVFGNGIGYPRVDWLLFGGCAEEQKYKNFLRRHTLPTQVWYKAYPGLTAIDLERNSRVREGLERSFASDEEARGWAALL